MLYDVLIAKLSIILIFFALPEVSFFSKTLASTIFTRLKETVPLLLDNEGVPNIFPSKIEYSLFRPDVSV